MGFETPEISNEAEKSREEQKAEFLAEAAQKTLDGDHVFGDVLYEDIQTFLDNEGADLDEGVKSQLGDIREKLPEAEINNIYQKIEGLSEGGDTSNAALWQETLTTRLNELEADSSLPQDVIEHFRVKKEEIEEKLYPEFHALEQRGARIDDETKEAIKQSIFEYDMEQGSEKIELLLAQDDISQAAEVFKEFEGKLKTHQRNDSLPQEVMEKFREKYEDFGKTIYPEQIS